MYQDRLSIGGDSITQHVSGVAQVTSVDGRGDVVWLNRVSTCSTLSVRPHRHLSLLVAWLALIAAAPALAWDAAGHRTLAAIAYRQLSSATRTAVDAMLAHHPAASDWDAD